MGLNCVVYTLSLIDKQLYAIQIVASFSLPRTTGQLKQGGIRKVISGLYQIKEMITNLEDNLAEYGRDTTNKIMTITGTKNSPRRINLKDWISNVVWYKTEMDADDDDDDEDEDNDD